MVTQSRAGTGGAAEAGDRYGALVAHWWTFAANDAPGVGDGHAQEAAEVARRRESASRARYRTKRTWPVMPP